MDGPGDRRVIKTARTAEEINAAAQKGFRPLVKLVQPGKDIHYMVGVFQDPETGEIEVSGDLRNAPRGEEVIGYTYYYPYHFPNPFAAYLVPPVIGDGVEVWLKGLIEDMVAVWGNQGFHPRLPAAPAVWNGTDFDVQFDPNRDAEEWTG